MKNKPKNSEAFPRPASMGIDYLTGEDAPVEPQRGMTLRDYFAASALQGIIAANKPIYGTEVSMPNIHEIHCNEALRYADQMLKARQDENI